MKTEHRMTVTAIVCDDGTVALCGLTYEDTPGAKIVGNGTIPHPLKVEFDALHASAPDLLAALEDCMVGLDAFMRHRGKYDDPRVVKARAAILKAKE